MWKIDNVNLSVFSAYCRFEKYQNGKAFNQYLSNESYWTRSAKWKSDYY